ncbi:MAG: YceH family protein [Gemmatimonadales bacterium]
MQLSPTEVRVLGALIEKEATTPDAYPLSLNALTTACNQTSNRDPVMDLGEDVVRIAVNNLRQQSLARAAQSSGSRVMKFQHLADDKLNLDAKLLGVLCVLMLRGPQTPGEIRGRAHRLAELTTVADADAALECLRVKELAVELPRRPGQKEARWAHLLSGTPAPEIIEPESPDRPARRTDERDERIAALERDVARLSAELDSLRKQLVAIL